MKIAYLARKPIPSMDANSVQIVKMCEGFARIGHDVTLYGVRGDARGDTTFERYGVARNFDVDIYPKRLQMLQKWQFVAHLRRDPRVRQADLFYSRDPLSLMAVARFGKPMIYEAHLLPPNGSLRRRLLGRLFKLANLSHLVTVTSTLAEMYRSHFPELANKTVMVEPNAGADFDTSLLDSGARGRSPRLQVGFVGRPFPGKGIELIAAAAPRLPNCDFHIIGADAKALDWIDQPFAPNLHFHGYQPHGALGAYLAGFDVAVAPYGQTVMNVSGIESAAITSPLKLLEYMAAGLPTVISDLPGVRDLIGSEEVALLVPPGDVDAFVGAVERLAADKPLRERMGAAARRYFMQQRTTEARARRVLEPITDRSAPNR